MHRKRHEHNSDRAATARVGRARAEFIKARKTGMCFAAEFDAEHCAGGIINAHAVQRSGVLTRIAEDGHVMKGIYEDRSFKLKKIGINQASTFRGFCSQHDNSIFAPLDRHNFEGTREQAFLLYLRALAYESHKKTAVTIGLPHVGEAFASPEVNNPIGAEFLDDHLVGTSIGLEGMERDRNRAWQMLRSGDYSSVGVIAFLFEESPEVVVCGWVTPDYDFHGRHIQDVEDLTTPLTGIACFILPTKDGGMAGLAFPERTPASHRLIRSAMRLDSTIAQHALLRFALSYSEDCYFAPSFCHNLDPQSRDWILSRCEIGTTTRPHSAHQLLDDGVRLVPWKVTKRIVVEPRGYGLRGLRSNDAAP